MIDFLYLQSLSVQPFQFSTILQCCTVKTVFARKLYRARLISLILKLNNTVQLKDSVDDVRMP
jgi:hypothetical protein